MYFLMNKDGLCEITPKVGEDFTRMGQQALTDEIRERVKQMEDFSFSFRGDDIFPSERVKAIEEIVRIQAAAILTMNVLVEGGEEELTFILSVDMNTEYYSVVKSEIPGEYKIYERQAIVALMRYRGKPLPDEIESMWY